MRQRACVCARAMCSVYAATRVPSRRGGGLRGRPLTAGWVLWLGRSRWSEPSLSSHTAGRAIETSAQPPAARELTRAPSRHPCRRSRHPCRRRSCRRSRHSPCRTAGPDAAGSCHTAAGSDRPDCSCRSCHPCRTAARGAAGSCRTWLGLGLGVVVKVGVRVGARVRVGVRVGVRVRGLGSGLGPGPGLGLGGALLLVLPLVGPLAV
eukprot:scaffold70199_cov58-Phaeocystis_antarctica.AAC.1